MSEYNGEMAPWNLEDIVRKALKKVADVSDNDPIEHYTFQHFKLFHKIVFLKAVEEQIAAWRIEKDYYYEIGLNEGDIKDICVGDFMMWLYDEKRVARGDNHVLTRQELM